MNILLVATDLVIQSRVAAAAARAGLAPPKAIGWQQAATLQNADLFQLALLDLTSPGMSVEEVVGVLRGRLGESARIVAFGPHVQTARLDAARRAGCDLVTSRGHFDRNLDAILSQSLEVGD
jgi:hypothetical protein